MTSYADFVPRTKAIRVGDAEMDVQEFTIAKRDAALRVLLSGLDVASLVKPFWDAARTLKGKDEDKMVDLAVVAGKLKESVLRVLGEDLTTISCIALDTPQNRRKLAAMLADAAVEKVETDKRHGYTYSPAFHAWTRENLTARQEYALLEAVVETNDFVGLVKNYATLVTRTVQEARAKEAKK